MSRPLRTALLLPCVLLAVLAFAPEAGASKYMLSVMQDDNQLIYTSAANRDASLRRMKVLGVDAVRVTVLWSAVAPRKPRRGQDPRSYRASLWDKYDDLVRSAAKVQILVYFDVTPPGARWSQGKANDPANQRAWKPNIREFERFYRAVGRRYDGKYRDENQGKQILPRVSWWGIGNEPNQGGWLMPQAMKIGRKIVPTSPGLYRKMLVAGAKALIRSGHGYDLILMAETAPLGVRPQSERRPLRPALFIRELFCLDGRLHSYRGAAARARGCRDVKTLAILKKLPLLTFAHHPYTKDTSPVKKDRSRDSITVANLKTLPALLDRIARKTKLIPESLPILLTEFGYETNPPDPFNGIKQDTQAEWLNLGDYAAYRSPRVFANTQFLLFDVAPRTEFPRNSQAYWFTYQSGLYTAQGRAKPSAFAYMMPLVAKRSGGGFLFWGQVRFTPNGANQTVYLQRKVGNDWINQGSVQVTNAVGFWESVKPAAAGQTWRAVWVSPDNSYFLLSRETKLK